MSDPKDKTDRRGGPGAVDDTRALLPDLVRRAFALGLSGLFTTEEAFRRALGDTVPRDWVDFAADQGERTRSELAGRIAEELARVIESMDLEEMMRRLLSEHRFEIRAEVSLVQHDASTSRSGAPGGKERKSGGSSVKVVRGGSRK